MEYEGQQKSQDEGRVGEKGWPESQRLTVGREIDNRRALDT